MGQPRFRAAGRHRGRADRHPQRTGDHPGIPDDDDELLLRRADHASPRTAAGRRHRELTVVSRVVVDLLGFTGSRGGTETYARELLTRLPALLPDARFAALTGRVGAERVAEFFPGRVHTLPWVGADPATWAAGAVLGTDGFARRNGADLVWAPANFGPIFRGIPRVVTVHDAIYDEIRGSLTERFQRAGTSFLMDRSATP